MNTENYQKLLSSLTDVISPFDATDDKTKTKLNIDNRTINIPTVFKDIVVEGDTNSKTIAFTMNRYYDNIDLSDKKIVIKYINANKQGNWVKATNISFTEEYISFIWLIDDKVTVKEGNVSYYILFFGKRDGKPYRLYTNPSYFHVEVGLDVDKTIAYSFPSVLQDHELRITLLKEDFDKLIDGDFPINTNGVPKAPSDGKLYVMKNDKWVEIDSIIEELRKGGNPESTKKTPATSSSLPPHITPSGGDTPFLTFSDEQYDAAITWQPSIDSTFDYATEYTATIKITPRGDFTFEDADADIFDIGVPGASVTFDPETGTATVTFPRTTPPPVENNSWQLTYSFPSSYTTFTMNNNGKLSLSSMEGYDGSQELSDELYYLGSPSDMPVKLMYKYVSDSDWRVASFDNFASDPPGANSIRSWGWDTQSGSIYITGSNSTGAPIELRLMKEEVQE